MTPTQVDVLNLLSENGPVTLTSLAELTGKSKPNLSAILSRLKRRGLVKKCLNGSFTTVNWINSPSEEVNTVNSSETEATPTINDVNNSELSIHLKSENKYLRERVATLEKSLVDEIRGLRKVLDQEQQLHAISQKTIESQRLQLEESQRPKPLMARLKAIFGAE
jgi:DNA-binding transcriptional regulator GbsR (MarR family)|tara:strand:+ start:347 stop:841 length:495 start_codon:yes stop_codon:yes gene_type:complete